MAGEKHYDEGILRDRTRAVAKVLYEKRWGKLTNADAMTLDVVKWREAWVVGADVEKRAQRHFAQITKAITEAACFVQACHETPHPHAKTWSPPPPAVGLPMGTAAQVLEQSLPGLLSALEGMDQKRKDKAVMVGAETPNRATWINRRVLGPGAFYADEDELSKASRAELGALAILAGWWPAEATGRAVTMKGMTVDHVLAVEGDLMARAVNGICSPPGEVFRSSRAHDAPCDDNDDDGDDEMARGRGDPLDGAPDRSSDRM